jgi:hypothetical protein
MATATRSESKSAFIEQLLRQDPYANFKSVNEAWAASGHEGTISQALVNKMRSEAGLSGNLRTKEKPDTTGPSKSEAPAQVGMKRSRRPKVRARDQGKTPFVEEFLNEHPEGNVRAVNEAWQAAGFDGTISPTLVHQMRARLGLTGNLRGKTEKAEAASPTKPSTGKKRGRKPKGTTPETSPATTGGETRGRKSARTSGLLELEGDIDRLIFKLMGVGDLPEIEGSLRQARRLLYGTLNQG